MLIDITLYAPNLNLRNVLFIETFQALAFMYFLRRTIFRWCFWRKCQDMFKWNTNCQLDRKVTTCKADTWPITRSIFPLEKLSLLVKIMIRSALIKIACGWAIWLRIVIMSHRWAYLGSNKCFSQTCVTRPICITLKSYQIFSENKNESYPTTNEVLFPKRL